MVEIIKRFLCSLYKIPPILFDTHIYKSFTIALINLDSIFSSSDPLYLLKKYDTELSTD